MSDLIPLDTSRRIRLSSTWLHRCCFRSDILRERLKRVPWFGVFASITTLMELVEPLVVENAEYDWTRVSTILLWAGMAGASFEKSRETQAARRASQ